MIDRNENHEWEEKKAVGNLMRQMEGAGDGNVKGEREWQVSDLCSSPSPSHVETTYWFSVLMQVKNISTRTKCVIKLVLLCCHISEKACNC